jgi:hypothetical protein
MEKTRGRHRRPLPNRVCLSLLSPALARPVDLVADLLLRRIAFAVHTCAAPAWSAVAVPPFPAPLVWIAYGCIWTALWRIGVGMNGPQRRTAEP